MDRPAGTLINNYGDDLSAIATKPQWFILICGLILLFVSPTFLNIEQINLINLIGITLISVQGLSLLVGYAGQLSLAQSSFMAVGAYMSAICMNQLHLSFWFAVPIAAVVTGLIGLIFGLPSLRLKGFYLAISTLAAQYIINWVIMHTEKWGAGNDTITVPAPEIFGLKLTSPEQMFYLIVPLAIIATVVVMNIMRTRTGRALIAIRDNEIAAEVMGLNTFKYKLLAFFICSVFAGVAGALYGSLTRGLRPEFFNESLSINYLGMLIIGGVGSNAGTVFGVVFFMLLDWLVTWIMPLVMSIFPAFGPGAAASLSQVIWALVIIGFLLKAPRGLIHVWNRLKAWFRLWPLSY